MTFRDEIILGAIFLVVLTFVVWIFIQRRRASKKIVEPTAQPEQITPAPSAPLAKEAVKTSRWGGALAVLRPLFTEGTRDLKKWEEALIRSDMSPRLASEVLAELPSSGLEPQAYLKGRLTNLLQGAQRDDAPWKNYHPYVVYIVGVNGVGKTTSIVKLGLFFKKQGLDVGVVGADTFRKAAIEQLERGCEKAQLDFFSVRASAESTEGADPSAVIFDGLKKFSKKDIVLVDTSGRLHSKTQLMDELKKMKRVGAKALEGAPHEVWIVLDATAGQNLVAQAKTFHEAMGLTGMILTKLDGLSRGGSVFQVFRDLQIPIRFIGTGESLDDIESFQTTQFIEELFDQKGPHS